jgi:hypothetical protein
MAEPFKLGSASSLALDEENGHIYWRGAPSSTTELGIHRLDLTDGSDAILFDVVDRFNASIALDPVSDHLYWSDQGGIWRSDLDGNDIQLIIPDAGNVASIAVAPVPEPSTLVLTLMAFVLAFGRRGRGRIGSGRTTR